MNGLFIVCIIASFCVQSVSESATRTMLRAASSSSLLAQCPVFCWGNFFFLRKLQNVDTHSSFGSRGANILCTKVLHSYLQYLAMSWGPAPTVLPHSCLPMLQKGVWPLQGIGRVGGLGGGGVKGLWIVSSLIQKYGPKCCVFSSSSLFIYVRLWDKVDLL